jgi:hypothetical protein
MELLNKALTVKKQAEWAKTLNITDSAFSKAKERGRLSPTLAGALASHMEEDSAKWIAIAAIEAEPDTPLRDRLLKTVRRW